MKYLYLTPKDSRKKMAINFDHVVAFDPDSTGTKTRIHFRWPNDKPLTVEEAFEVVRGRLRGNAPNE